jgi:hypothetical protein
MGLRLIVTSGDPGLDFFKLSETGAQFLLPIMIASNTDRFDCCRQNIVLDAIPWAIAKTIDSLEVQACRTPYRQSRNCKILASPVA